MTRIKIQDLPKDMKISKDQMRKVLGGIDTAPLPEMPVRFGREREIPYRFAREFLPL
jgi:hypothetical protein